ncbi:MAG TPA: DUF3471 domain-containing protein [Gemmatimonadaceae bacterium]|nr:DUF3471 domain-containing protein [Gemmatimonadaceae bacterium]
MKKDRARLGLISILVSSPLLGLLAQATSPTAFVTTTGKDTFCLEQFVRRGNVVSGTWVVLHPPGVYVHDYRITLADDGLPVAYTMRYSTPGAPTPPGLDSVSVTYGGDSATLVSFRKDSTTARRIAMREAFPLLGQSYVGVELALERLRRMHLDSSTVVLHAPTEPNRSVMVLLVRFFSDSASIGAGIRAHVAADGNILGFRSGATELRRVDPFDMPALVDGFVSSMAPRMAAVAAAMASRKEIALPTAQLDRFAGRYSLGDAAIAIARDSDHLMMQLPGQPAVQLLAMSATEFFVRNVDLVISFESDAAGRVTGLRIAQGESRQRLVRRN